MKVKLHCPYASLLLATIILNGLSSCTSNSTVQLHSDSIEVPELASESDGKPTSEDAQIEYPVRAFTQQGLYELLVAEVAGYRGQYKIALSKYLEQAKATQDAGVAARTTRLANYLKDQRSIFLASRIWVQADPDSLEARRYFVDQLIRQRDYVQAMSQMKEVKRLGGDAHFDIFAYRVASMDVESRHNLLLSVVEMLDSFPADKDLRFTQAALLEQTGEPEKALEIVDLLLAEGVHDTRLNGPSNPLCEETHIVCQHLIPSGYFRLLDSALKQLNGDARVAMFRGSLTDCAQNAIRHRAVMTGEFGSLAGDFHQGIGVVRLHSNVVPLSKAREYRGLQLVEHLLLTDDDQRDCPRLLLALIDAQ